MLINDFFNCLIIYKFCYKDIFHDVVSICFFCIFVKRVTLYIFPTAFPNLKFRYPIHLYYKFLKKGTSRFVIISLQLTIPMHFHFHLSLRDIFYPLWVVAAVCWCKAISVSLFQVSVGTKFVPINKYHEVKKSAILMIPIS